MHAPCSEGRPKHEDEDEAEADSESLNNPENVAFQTTDAMVKSLWFYPTKINCALSSWGSIRKYLHPTLYRRHHALPTVQD